MTSTDRWSLDFAEDVDLPGWVFLPVGLEEEDRELWLTEVSTALSDLVGSRSIDGVPMTTAEARSVLESGLAARAESESYVLYQVWPVTAPATVLCHVNPVRSEDLPDWSQLEGRIHAAEARYIGPGLQYSTRRTVESDEGPVEVNSVHFVFDDGEAALMLNLEESVSALISQALVGFSLLKNALVMTRDDGSRFTSTTPAVLLEDEYWPDDQD
ncbi:hypothetical protein KUV85_07910 [Nocardioides panacisoli]|uniref:hypothetical protein n=1 Tax=Nocardioides panacisoli TaxID=627624 RepID=UPI001C625A2B|nr:hypothetical protein [Nocardioides panacisoli]QYJ05590.1 hypothetical protein KUV85_07910 [Nocardioides panacisoli]